MRTDRHDFLAEVKVALAKRAGFMCTICRAVTVGPSAESPAAITNVGVAAHITAASPGGPRYDVSLAPSERGSISNGIWLCQVHAKAADDDVISWTVVRLRDTKATHETYVKEMIGVPRPVVTPFHGSPGDRRPGAITPREYAFVEVSTLHEAYRAVLGPMFRDCGMDDQTRLGVLMCTTSSAGRQEMQWTVFVNAEWLKWYIDGQTSGYKVAPEVPQKQVYGCIPAWPDTFAEFLAAIVLTDSTFSWQRHPDGYLILAQVL